MKKLIVCLLFLFFCFGVTAVAADNVVVIQGKYLEMDGQNFIKIVHGGDTISVKNIQSPVGFPYFARAGFPTGEHMGGGPGFCLIECCAWNGEDDLFLELSFNKTSSAEWNFTQSIYRVNKQGEAFLVCVSDRVYELVASYGENILAVDAVYSSDNVKSALTEVYSKSGALLHSNYCSLDVEACVILNKFKLKQKDTLWYYFENCYFDYAIPDSGYFILSSVSVIESAMRTTTQKFSRQDVAYFDSGGRKVNNKNLARGLIIFRRDDRAITKMNFNKRNH